METCHASAKCPHSLYGSRFWDGPMSQRAPEIHPAQPCSSRSPWKIKKLHTDTKLLQNGSSSVWKLLKQDLRSVGVLAGSVTQGVAIWTYGLEVQGMQLAKVGKHTGQVFLSLNSETWEKLIIDNCFTSSINANHFFSQLALMLLHTLTLNLQDVYQSKSMLII